MIGLARNTQTVARHYGVGYRQNGTSHVFFSFGPGCLPVPAHRPVKAVYARESVELMDARLAEREEAEE